MMRWWVLVHCGHKGPLAVPPSIHNWIGCPIQTLYQGFEGQPSASFTFGSANFQLYTESQWRPCFGLEATVQWLCSGTGLGITSYHWMALLTRHTTFLSGTFGMLNMTDLLLLEFAAFPQFIPHSS